MSKARKLREIEAIKEGIHFTKQMIKHNPYKEDKKELKQQLKDLNRDLVEAWQELKESEAK
jgi:glutamine synthetase